MKSNEDPENHFTFEDENEVITPNPKFGVNSKFFTKPSANGEQKSVAQNPRLEKRQMSPESEDEQRNTRLKQ